MNHQQTFKCLKDLKVPYVFSLRGVTNMVIIKIKYILRFSTAVSFVAFGIITEMYLYVPILNPI